MHNTLNEALDKWKNLAGHGFIVALLDFAFLAFAAYLGYAIRLTLFIPQVNRVDLERVAFAFSCWTVFVFFLGGQYRTLWTQAGMEDYIRFARLYLAGAVAFTIFGFWVRFALLPRTSLAIMLFAGILFCGGLRVSWRLAHPSLYPGQERLETLIVGAGETGALLARDLLRHEGDLRLCGFVDDDPQKEGKRISGLAVLGETKDLPTLIREHRVKVVLVAMPSASGRKIRALYDRLAPLGVSVRVLPSLRELAGGEISVNRLRQIRLEDLLGREPVQIDIQKIAAYLRGRTVLVTGAGGSIGSEIVRQILQNDPKEVILLGHGEQSIYLLLESFRKSPVRVPLHPIVADVADEVAMRSVFRSRRPQVIFHAAAHKHVPLMEDNPREALRVNALGTLTIAELAGEFYAERMVLISTDKAVNPSSVMGASKRVAELLLGETQKRFPETIYMAVRFGNVLGSRGSVVPKFEEQIAGGGPVTVTDPAMKRYFMLIPEAVSLVIQAGAIGQGGELFVLDMGDPISIAEMAEILIRLHGYEPGKDIAIAYTGIRPGEKLFEELFYDPATVQPTAHPKVFASALAATNGSAKTPDIASLLRQSLREPDSASSLLHTVVPEYVGYTFESSTVLSPSGSNGSQ
ncbi:MAG: polysaccharide biosynthesis protein [Synergistaceae bacterium]|jgi:FlaA1/EpsC-like NDP-sugar epimerase|nr:polysaccharide biosynthesis protein [Synergistaceae bacterium]